MRNVVIAAMWLVWLAISAGVADASEGLEPLPQGQSGIAARYPGDIGIGKDGAVLFVEDFEEADLAGILARWTDVSNKDGKVLSLSDDVPEASLGKASLQMTATKGHDTGGYLWKLLKPGVDRMYARFYVKFAEDHPYVHHLVKIGAWRDSPPWPQGEAGHRHDGARSFQTGVETGSNWGRSQPPGNWFLYTYWQGMRSWQGPKGTSFYGNAFAPAEPEPAPRGKWQCVEFMVKANTSPETHDGEQAFWIDGRLVGRWAPGTPVGRWVKDRFLVGDGEPFEGFQWRTADEVKINTFWLLYYMASVFKDTNQMTPKVDVGPYNRDVGRIWFDHVVLATEYIGPITPDAARPARKSP